MCADQRRATRAIAAVVLAAAVSAGAAGEAQPATAALRYDNGVRLYSMRRYVEAAHEFEAAYSLSRRVELLFNLGRAWEDAGDVARAVDAYSRFEAAGAPGYDLASLQAALQRLRARLPVERPAPPVVVRAAPVVVAPTPPRAPARGAPVGPIVLMSIGGAALVGAIPLWVSARSTYDDLVAVCPTRTCPVEFEGDARRAERFAVAGDVLVGVGAASLAAGLTWLLLDRRGAASDGARRVTLECTQGGCVAGVGGRF